MTEMLDPTSTLFMYVPGCALILMLLVLHHLDGIPGQSKNLRFYVRSRGFLYFCLGCLVMVFMTAVDPQKTMELFHKLTWIELLTGPFRLAWVIINMPFH